MTVLILSELLSQELNIGRPTLGRPAYVKYV